MKRNENNKIKFNSGMAVFGKAHEIKSQKYGERKKSKNNEIYVASKINQ